MSEALIVRRGGAVKSKKVISFYDKGVFSDEYLHFTKQSPTTTTVTYNDTYIQMKTVAQTTSEVYVVFGPVSLDKLDTITLNGVFPDTAGAGTQQAVVFVHPSNDASYANAFAIDTASVVNASENTSFSAVLDVSGLGGEYYIYVGTHTSGSAWSLQRVVNITSVQGMSGTSGNKAELEYYYKAGIGSLIGDWKGLIRSSAVISIAFGSSYIGIHLNEANLTEWNIQSPAIDLTNVSTLCFDVMPSDKAFTCGVSTTQYTAWTSAPEFAASVTTGSTAVRQLKMLDVSGLSGVHYITFNSTYNDAGSDYYIFNVWAE